MRIILGLSCLTLLAACSADAGGPARYRESGQIIAFSGGDAGADFACSVCHGVDGEGDGDIAPRLAGLDAGYLVRQLSLYDEGLRTHPQMRAVSRKLSMDERLAVAEYYASLQYTTPGSPPAPDEEGQGLYMKACASCHGPAGQGRPGIPAIAGQSAPYVLKQFAAWKTGDRRGDADGTMTRISRQWPDSQKRLVAAHVASLLGDLRRPESPAASLPIRRDDPRSDASAPRPRASGPAAPAQ